MNYLDFLRQSAADTGSIACMGLDINIKAIPRDPKRSLTEDIVFFYRTIFEEMVKQNVFPGAFKPNLGFYLDLDKPREHMYNGSDALGYTIDMLESMFPNIPIILDFKTEDIAASAGNYASVIYNRWRARAGTAGLYPGKDSAMEFAKYCDEAGGRGVYFLCRTSNPSAGNFQSFTNADGLSLYLEVADKVMEWSQSPPGYPGAGIVIGTTAEYLNELTNITKRVKQAKRSLPVLIPGVGTQGGPAPEIIAKLEDAGYDLDLVRINSSSGLTHPWKTVDKIPADWQKVCVANLFKLNQEIGYKTSYG